MSMTPSRRQTEALQLKHVAADGRVFVVRCSLCRTIEHYLATDLLWVYDENTPVVSMMENCRHCGKSAYQYVSTRLPTSDDVGHLLLRRPAGVQTIQLWTNAWYGPDA